MTSEQIEMLLNALNMSEDMYDVYARSISPFVEYAKVWMPRPTANAEVGQDAADFYLVKNVDGWYVGAVYDMLSDLHWYMLPRFRRKGIMSSAMRSAILPHIFLSRDVQRLSISKEMLDVAVYQSSKFLAESLGFSESDNDFYVLTKKRFELRNNQQGSSGWNQEISRSRMQEIKRKINYASVVLRQVQAELEMSLDDSWGIDVTIGEVDRFRLQFEDNWYSKFEPL